MSGSPTNPGEQYNWSVVAAEQMNSQVRRQMFHTETMTVARVALAKGATVPEHLHTNEQISMIESGKMKFVLAGVQTLLSPGDMLRIPPNVPHWVEAIEDSVVVDLFSPRREDWIRGDDGYLRGR